MKKKEITKSEWEIIGEMTIFRPCWDTIVKYAKKPVMRMLKRLDKMGFGEYLEYYKIYRGKQTPRLLYERRGTFDK
jgi:hypothetical protein